MRKLAFVSIAPLLAWVVLADLSPAVAAPANMACPPPPVDPMDPDAAKFYVPKDCFAEEVLIVDGAALVNGEPIVTCAPVDTGMGGAGGMGGAAGAAGMSGTGGMGGAAGMSGMDGGAGMGGAGGMGGMAGMSGMDGGAGMGGAGGMGGMAGMSGGGGMPGMAVGTPDPANCTLNAGLAVTRALEIIKAGGATVHPTHQWDQIVVFGADIAPRVNSPGPLFYREGFDPMDAGSWGVNEVDGIGIPLKPRIEGRPFVGWIHAGSTTQVGSGGLPGKAAYPNCSPTDSPGLCFSAGTYTLFDALAQATGSMFGPYLKWAKSEELKGDLAAIPTAKAKMVGMDGKVLPQYEYLYPRIWNAFLNTRGSLFAGNNWRDNGNATFETTKASPFYGINPPYGKAGTDTTLQNGAGVLRFVPIDLYLMGFMSQDDANLRSMQFFHGIEPRDVYRPQLPVFDGINAGPGIGVRTGLAIRPPLRSEMYELKFEHILAANPTANNTVGRRPSYEEAPHHIKQLWVLVTKPASVLPQRPKDEMPPGLSADEQKKWKADYDARFAAAVNAVRDQNAEITKVKPWRRQWAHYFYALTGYRGRVITTFEGNVDDMTYWEFGSPIDDGKHFKLEGGLKGRVTGNEQAVTWAPGLPVVVGDIQNVLHIDSTPGMAGVVRFGAAQGGLTPKIIADSMSSWPPNAAIIRMRVRPGAVAPKSSHAVLQFNGGVAMRIPSTCGAGAKADCKEEGFLLPDGKWHNYAANLAGAQGVLGPGKAYDGFTFIPSSEPAGEIDIEYIRVINVQSSSDSDDDCPLPGKKDRPKRPDGWVDSEDNCPKHYNPDQLDGNEDGIGDACEDYDGDTKENMCDNCPTLTNSSQSDKDEDGEGDICDGQTDELCAITHTTLAGRLPSSPSALMLAFFASLAGLIVVRRFRHRR